MQYPNIVEFEVTGDYGLFSDPIMRVGGEKASYQVPTYEALKGILMSVYWKPTLIWIIDEVRIMNRIQTEVKGVRPIKYYNDKNDLAYYTYLKNCRYQVRAHFEWNENRPELAEDRSENKHHQIAKRMITYADEAYSPETQGKMTARFWRPVMKKGVIKFIRPEECIHKELRSMSVKAFGRDLGNFSGLSEFEEVD